MKITIIHIYIEINTHLLLNNTEIQFALSSRYCLAINIKQTSFDDEYDENEKMYLFVRQGLVMSTAMLIPCKNLQ